MAKKRLGLARREQARLAQEQVELEEELHKTGLRLRRAYAAFDLVTDPDLVEAWVYEINAQQSRYTYLLRRRKAMEAQPNQDEVIT